MSTLIPVGDLHREFLQALADAGGVSVEEVIGSFNAWAEAMVDAVVEALRDPQSPAYHTLAAYAQSLLLATAVDKLGEDARERAWLGLYQNEVAVIDDFFAAMLARVEREYRIGNRRVVAEQLREAARLRHQHSPDRPLPIIIGERAS